MSQTLAKPVQSEELTRLEILREFKQHFAGGGDRNRSPFADDLVIRYDTDVAALDVPEIHFAVRQAIQESLAAIGRGEPSRVVILAGEPGTGKSHLINHFRDPQLANKLHYVLVCNSNHWKVQEFEERLLDSILNALCRPSHHEPGRDLLLEIIEDVAFQALGQILQRPGQLKRFTGRKDTTWRRRAWLKLFGDRRSRFQQAYERRDARIFGRLDFRSFAEYVCDHFLVHEPGNPFHRYVMQVLLRYLFAEDRNEVLHWLRRKKVRSAFFDRLHVEEAVDRNFKVVDTIKILISLFTPEVARGLNPATAAERSKVFFFAFDQIEGREELFEDEKDWQKFFAQLSELYNTLPNVFILFPMTTGLRDRLYAKMERQFKARIHKDHKFVLEELDDKEVLAVFRRRMQRWLGDALPQLRPLLDDPNFAYLPFTAKGLAEFCRSKTLRESLEEMDVRFRNEIDEKVDVDNPRLEYLVARNEIKLEEEKVSPSKYTESHLTHVAELLSQTGGMLAAAHGLTYCGFSDCQTADEWPALQLEFRHPQNDEWVRVFLTRLPFSFNNKLDSCVELLKHKSTERYFLWLVRAEKAHAAWEERKPNQVFARLLDPTTQTTIRAMLRLLAKRERLKPECWPLAEQVLIEEFKLTYLGEMFHHVAKVLGVDLSPGEPAVLSVTRATAEVKG